MRGHTLITHGYEIVNAPYSFNSLWSKLCTLCARNCMLLFHFILNDQLILLILWIIITLWVATGTPFQKGRQLQKTWNVEMLTLNLGILTLTSLSLLDKTQNNSVNGILNNYTHICKQHLYKKDFIPSFLTI